MTDLAMDTLPVADAPIPAVKPWEADWSANSQPVPSVVPADQDAKSVAKPWEMQWSAKSPEPAKPWEMKWSPDQNPVTDQPKPEEKGYLDSAANIVKGTGERVADLFGGFGDLIAATAPEDEDGVVRALPSFMYSDKGKPEDSLYPTKSDLQKASKEIHDVSFGYEPGTSWEDVKKSPARNFIPFAVEQGLVSTPDMAAVLLNLPGYVAMRTGELGQQRAANDERQEPTVEDMLKAMPAATASALLDRVGAKGMFGLDEVAIQGFKQLPKAAAKASVKEGATEAGQQVIEDVGTDAGTKKGFDPARTAENALASAVGGAVFGAATRGIEGTAELATGAKKGKVGASNLPPLPEGFTLDPTIQKSGRLPMEGKPSATVETVDPSRDQAPVTRDGSEEKVSPPDTSLPFASPEERAILRRTSIPDDDIDAMSRPEIDQKVSEARAANVRVNEAMVRKAAQYQPLIAETIPALPVGENAPIPEARPVNNLPIDRNTDRQAANAVFAVRPDLEAAVEQSLAADREADINRAVNPEIQQELARTAQDQVEQDRNKAADQALAYAEPDLSKAVQQSVLEDMKGNGTRQSPVVVQQPAHIDVAAQQVNTSPSDAQKEANNYKHGHLKVSGLDVTLESPKGSIRSGKSADGTPWQVEMPAHYGYLKKSVGADNDHVDAYIGDNPQSKRVYVIDQKDLNTRRFDEHKSVLGVNSVTEARDLYARSFSDGRGPERLGGITPMSISEFRRWLASGDTKKPLAMGKPKVRTNDQGFPIDIKGNVKKPDSLIEFLARKGGVREDRGELSVLGLRDRKAGFVVGAGPLIRRNGMTPDKAREAAAEAGYLPMDSSLKDFYDALDQDARSGRQAFSQYDDDQATRWREEQGGEAKQAEEDASRSEAYDRLKADGFPVDEGADFADRVSAHMANGQSYENAVEQAYQDIGAAQPEIADIPFFGDDTNETDAGTAPVDRAPSGAESELDQRSGGSGPIEADREDGAVRGESRTETSSSRGQQDSGRGDQQSSTQRQEPQSQEQVTEAGADNLPQLVIPGAERASDATMAQRGANAALKPKVAQKNAGGLFSDERDQGDLLDVAKKPEAPGKLQPPSTVYHGTSTGGFDTFDTYQGKYGLFGSGGYFTEDPNIALDYTRKGKGATPTVYSAHLKIKNALDMDAKADLAAWEKAFPDYFDASEVPEDATNEQAYRAVEENLSQEMIPDYEGAETMQDGIMSMGYDAITHIGGGRHKASKGTKHRVWIVFDPEQVTNFTEEERQYSANPSAPDTPAFKRWFGESKVVDGNGAPLVVYHGAQSNISAFKDGRPIWFADNPKLSALYARGSSGKQHAVFLRIERPLDLTSIDVKSKVSAEDLASLAGSPQMATRLARSLEIDRDRKFTAWQLVNSEEFRDAAAKAGFDGVIQNEGSGERSGRTYGAFSPGQIKSVDNNGTFDPNDARIDYKSTPAGWDTAGEMDAKPLLSKADQQKLADIVRTTAGLDPEFVDSIKIPEGGAKGWGNLDASTAAGAYSPFRDVVTLALDSGSEKAAQHESFHRLQNLFLTDKEHKVLKADEPRLRQMIADNGTYSADTAAKMSRKEVEAEAFGIWATEKKNGESTPKLHIALRKVWNNIAKMLERVRNYLNGRGFQTLEDVFGKAKLGEIAKRPKREAKSAETQYAIIDERGPVAEPETEAATPEAAIGTRINDYLKGASKALASKIKSKGSRFDRSTADDTETLAELAHRKIVDYLSPVKRMQEKAGAENLNDLADAYLTARLAEGTIRHEIHQIDEKYVTPAVDELARVGASLEDLHKFMYAMHAPERNRVVGLRNEEGSDLYKAATDPTIRGASGMSTNEARDTIREMQADREKFMGIRRAASHIRAMLDNGLETQLRNGLINKETYERLTGQWQNYVPLHAESDTDGVGGSFPSKSRGFDVRGDEFKGATGRFTPADNVVVYAINNAEQSVIRGEKNKAATAALRFINQYDPKGENIAQVYWTDQPEQLGDITKAPDVYKRVIGSDGKVTQRKANNFQMQDDVLAAKVGGKTYYMKFADPKVGLALKKMTFSELGVALKMVKTISNWQSIINTRANPAFIPLNLMRDVQTGATLALSKGFNTPEIAKMVGNIPSAWGALWRHARGKEGDGIWDTRLRDFMSAGGKISFDQYNSIEDTLKKLQSDMKARTSGNKAVGAWRSFIKLVTDLNDTIENGMRLAVFNAARQRGDTSKRAAFLARDLTVDFQKKGEITPSMNALYTFFNASVQGNYNFAKGLAKSRKVQSAMMGLMAAGFAQHLWNLAMAGNDDDGENAYLKMLKNEPWKLERNMVFFLPGRKDYVMMPLGFGLNAFWHLGVQGGAVTSGAKGVLPAVLDSTRVGFDAFNPLGSGGWVSMALPSIIDPIWELGTNQNFAGNPIYPSENQLDPAPPPKSEQAFKSTNPHFKDIAETLNRFSGGNKIEPGAADVYPDSLEYLWGWFTGGVGRFISQTGETAVRATDLEFEPKKTPFIRSFYGAADDQAKRSEYFNEREKVQYAKGKLKEYEDAGDEEDIKDFLARNKQDLNAAQAFEIAEKQRRKINKERRSLEKSKRPQSEVDNELDRLNDLELEIMNEARKQYFKAGRAPKAVPSQ